MSLDRSETQVVKELVDLAQRFANGERIDPGEMRRRIVDLEVARFEEKGQPRLVPVIFLMKGLLNELWSNFATDAPFDFPEDLPETQLFLKDLCQFVSLAAKNDEEADGAALISLFGAIGRFYELVRWAESEGAQACT